MWQGQAWHQHVPAPVGHRVSPAGAQVVSDGSAGHLGRISRGARQLDASPHSLHLQTPRHLGKALVGYYDTEAPEPAPGDIRQMV